jgi:hypothetical protein
MCRLQFNTDVEEEEKDLNDLVLDLIALGHLQWMFNKTRLETNNLIIKGVQMTKTSKPFKKPDM